MSTLLLTRRLAGGAAASSAGESIAYQAVRNHSGTGDTNAIFYVFRSASEPLLDLDAWSVRHNGVEVGAFLESVGFLVDGTTRFYRGNVSLAGLTQGVTDTNIEFRPTGGHSVARAERVDFQSYLTNSNVGTWGSYEGPPGFCAPQSASWMCPRSPIDRLIAYADQPSFDGSDDYQAQLIAARSWVESWDGTNGGFGPADYDTGLAILQTFLRTGDLSHLQLAYAFYSRLRTIYYKPEGFDFLPAWRPLAEWYSAWRTLVAGFLFFQDEIVEDYVLRSISEYSGTEPETVYDQGGGRLASGYLRLAAAARILGLQDEPAQYGGTIQDVIDDFMTWYQRTGSTTLFENSSGQTNVFGSNQAGSATLRVTYSYMHSMAGIGAYELGDELPASSLRTAMLARADAAADWLLNDSGLDTTTSYGYRTYDYSSGDLWLGLFAGLLSVGSTYTSGTSITLKGVPLAVGNGTNYGAGFITIAGTTRSFSAFVCDGVGNAVLALASGFPSGAAVDTTANCTQTAAGAPTAHHDDLVLNGFQALFFAWAAASTGNAAFANEARTLIATLGLPLGSGGDGPFINGIKPYIETYQGQAQFALLAQAGV